jgi:flagellar biosynthesis/type III secretory pathway protein FliH
MTKPFLVPAAIVLGLTAVAPASAQISTAPTWAYADEAQQPYIESRRVAYDNGYREGVREGDRDARGRETFSFQDERTWQRADKGYNRSFGDRWRYEQSFRTGYEAGYNDGYRRYAPNNGYGRPGPVYPNTRDNYGYGYPGQNGRYPGGGNYGSAYSSPAHANGVRDGYEKGREDARDRDPFDPRRHKWYREGDHDYKNSFGPRQRYEDLYRQGFTEGYDRGYREWSYRR